MSGRFEAQALFAWSSLKRSRGNPGASHCPPSQPHHLLNYAKACSLKCQAVSDKSTDQSWKRERGWEVRRQKDQWKAGEREMFGPFSAIEEHLNMTGHNYALLCCWLQMHALCYNFTPSISLKGLCTADPYNRVNAAVFEMINTKETRRKDKAAKKTTTKKR